MRLQAGIGDASTLAFSEKMGRFILFSKCLRALDASASKTREWYDEDGMAERAGRLRWRLLLVCEMIV